MVLLSPIGCVMLAGAFFALAGIRHARAASPRLTPLLAVTVVACLAAAVVGEARLPEIVTDGVKRMHPANRPPILFSRWSPVFRVDVLESPLFKHVGLALIHDGAVGSILPNVGADPGLLDGFFQKDSRALPLAVVEPEPTVTIIGSAGGSEILTARHLGAARVTGVELNPVTISLLTSHFRDFTGRMTDDPRVRLVNAEGRAYFDGTTERSDLIWFVAPDSYAAMNAATSGAYVLSESYLYTVEMIESALAHLEPRGVVCAQFGEINFPEKPNRTTRYLTTAREAFRRAGITDFSRHVLVATNPGYLFTTSTILLRREPFEPADVERLAAKAATTGSELRFARRPTEPDHPVTAAITLAPAELERWYDGYAWNVRPITDDAPFFWHFIGFPAAFRSALYPGPSATEEGLGERLLLVLLALVTAFAAVALLVPLVVRRTLWRAIPHKLDAGLYFASLGLGFMFFEVTLIQRLTLFLGYPTYALTVTLFALLVSTGIGSLLSERAVAARDRTVLRIGVVLIGLVLFYLFALGPLTARLGGAAFPLRVVVAVLVLFPLGLCLGMFMPLGLRSVAALTPHADAYVAWAWAVNGFFSVVASVLATMLSMTFGFTTVMVIALAIYGVAIVSLRRIPARL
jgi:spermidine synthase